MPNLNLELKKCPNPWCRYNDLHMGLQRRIIANAGAFNTVNFKVSCSCGCSGPTIVRQMTVEDLNESQPYDVYPEWGQAADAWNTRPTPLGGIEIKKSGAVPKGYIWIHPDTFDGLPGKDDLGIFKKIK